MYLEFYGLTEPPFNITPNPRFLFYSAKHREAFNHLLYGIRERKGFVQLTGEVGAGKTTLCRALLEALGDNTSTALILNPVLDADLLIKAKKTLLGYDAETFYTKLDSGEAVAVHGWDGWCNYAADPNVKWVLPSEGSDLFVDTMVIPKGSPRLEAAHQFIDFILKPENGQWVAENILYKVPNKAAMDALDPALLEKYPNMAITPAELLKQESLRDLGEGQTRFTEAATRVKAGS